MSIEAQSNLDWAISQIKSIHILFGLMLDSEPGKTLGLMELLLHVQMLNFYIWKHNMLVLTSFDGILYLGLLCWIIWYGLWKMFMWRVAVKNLQKRTRIPIFTCNYEYFLIIFICLIAMITFTNAIVYLLMMCIKFLMYQVLL